MAQNDAVVNNVCKLRLRALMTLLITRAVSFHFNVINYINVLITLIAINYLYQYLPKNLNEDNVGHYIIADGQVMPATDSNFRASQ